MERRLAAAVLALASTAGKSLGRGVWVGLSKGGPSVGRRGRRGSLSYGSRGGGGSVRLMKGLSYLFGKRRKSGYTG